ncbi:zinc-ribbon domain-containing protein [Ruminococcus sp.]|uniref:zinc-ribbon domain-containing protein n=1 Tax=Ruminococcus sp. TaxID=41978 RepID=UPI0025CCC979|nr:zinc-ribbon domain-containing protein [Ruminococcus sp.]MCR4637687.1 zinc-ribbon domain-containing protein [Ruminococcus sp.]
MICKKCGSNLPDDAIFCTECGARLDAETAPDVHTDDEPTSILPHLEEVIAANEETLSLTSGEAELLNDEPTEILSTSETIELPEPEPVTEVFSAQKPTEEKKPDKPADFPKQEAPAAPVSNNGFNDNSNTMKIPVQPVQSSIAPPPAKPPIQPAQPEPSPAPMPQQEDKPKARKKVGGGRIFGASLVTIFTVIFLLAFSLTLAVKIGANGSIIRKRAEKLNASTTLSAQFDGKELAKTLYDSMGFRTATRGAADEAGFKNYMMNTDFREYAGRVAKDYLDYIIGGKGSDPSITAEDFVNDFIKTNNNAAVREFDYELTDDGYELIEKNLEKDNFSDTMSVREWSRNLGFDVDKCSYAFSFITIGILAALVILLLIWTAVILNKRARFVTGFFATVFNISGLLVFISGLAILIGSAVAFTFTHNVGFYLAETLLLPFTCMLLIIGAAELFLGFIFRKSNRVLRKKAKKAAAAASAENN